MATEAKVHSDRDSTVSGRPGHAIQCIHWQLAVQWLSVAATGSWQGRSHLMGMIGPPPEGLLELRQKLRA